MTGLGSYYTRYSLNSESFNIGYDGKGCLLAAQLMPRHAKGWYARAAFESLTTERLNKSNNTVPITRLKTRQATLSAAYRSARWSLRAGGGYELRRSIEMIADRTGHSVIVDEQAMYKNRIWHADAEATVEWRRGTVNYMLSPRAEWRQSTATYAYPARRMRLAQFCGAVRGSAEWLRPQWRVKATAGIGCYVSPDEEVSLSNVLNNISEYLTYTAARLSGRAVAPGGVPAGRTPPEPESGLLRRGGVDAPVLQRRIGFASVSGIASEKGRRVSGLCPLFFIPCYACFF